ncbi:MAG: hypothetical protein HWD59_03275 [Coxiellaceae bacterium]|nr:MAG: hypothetical protein HWD59_03275 [Coxiellaceae bacterium]
MMVDPVLAKDGHTYEREAMIQWLEKSDKSPVTQEILKSKYLATNYFARNRIAGYHSAQAF